MKMQKNVTNAAYHTLVSLGFTFQDAEYNRDRNLWYFNASDDEFKAMCLALRENNQR